MISKILFTHILLLPIFNFSSTVHITPVCIVQYERLSCNPRLFRRGIDFKQVNVQSHRFMPERFEIILPNGTLYVRVANERE